MAEQALKTSSSTARLVIAARKDGHSEGLIARDGET